jgi:hypothetical protein
MEFLLDDDEAEDGSFIIRDKPGKMEMIDPFMEQLAWSF